MFFKCPINDCQKLFNCKKALKEHERTHDINRPFKCSQCDQTFTQFSSLQKHARVHDKQKPYVCDHPGCNQAFSQVSNLIRHQRIHSGEKPFKCNFCTKKFASGSNLKQHLQIHQNTEGRSNFECIFDGCYKNYLYQSSLKKHYLVCHHDLYQELLSDQNIETCGFRLNDKGEKIQYQIDGGIPYKLVQDNYQIDQQNDKKFNQNLIIINSELQKDQINQENNEINKTIGQQILLDEKTDKNNQEQQETQKLDPAREEYKKRMVQKGLLQSQQIKQNPLTQNFAIGKRGRPPNISKNLSKHEQAQKLQKTCDDNNFQIQNLFKLENDLANEIKNNIQDEKKQLKSEIINLDEQIVEQNVKTSSEMINQQSNDICKTSIDEIANQLTQKPLISQQTFQIEQGNQEFQNLNINNNLLYQFNGVQSLPPDLLKRDIPPKNAFINSNTILQNNNNNFNKFQEKNYMLEMIAQLGQISAQNLNQESNQVLILLMQYFVEAYQNSFIFQYNSPEASQKTEMNFEKFRQIINGVQQTQQQHLNIQNTMSQAQSHQQQSISDKQNNYNKNMQIQAQTTLANLLQLQQQQQVPISQGYLDMQKLVQNIPNLNLQQINNSISADGNSFNQVINQQYLQGFNNQQEQQQQQKHLGLNNYQLQKNNFNQTNDNNMLKRKQSSSKQKESLTADINNINFCNSSIQSSNQKLINNFNGAIFNEQINLTAPDTLKNFSLQNFMNEKNNININQNIQKRVAFEPEQENIQQNVDPKTLENNNINHRQMLQNKIKMSKSSQFRKMLNEISDDEEDSIQIIGQVDDVDNQVKEPEMSVKRKLSDEQIQLPLNTLIQSQYEKKDMSNVQNNENIQNENNKGNHFYNCQFIISGAPQNQDTQQQQQPQNNSNLSSVLQNNCQINEVTNSQEIKQAGREVNGQKQSLFEQIKKNSDKINKKHQAESHIADKLGQVNLQIINDYIINNPGLNKSKIQKQKDLIDHLPDLHKPEINNNIYQIQNMFQSKNVLNSFKPSFGQPDLLRQQSLNSIQLNSNSYKIRKNSQITQLQTYNKFNFGLQESDSCSPLPMNEKSNSIQIFRNNSYHQQQKKITSGFNFFKSYNNFQPDKQICLENSYPRLFSKSKFSSFQNLEDKKNISTGKEVFMGKELRVMGSNIFEQIQFIQEPTKPPSICSKSQNDFSQQNLLNASESFSNLNLQQTHDIIKRMQQDPDQYKQLIKATQNQASQMKLFQAQSKLQKNRNIFSNQYMNIQQNLTKTNQQLSFQQMCINNIEQNKQAKIQENNNKNNQKFVKNLRNYTKEGKMSGLFNILHKQGQQGQGNQQYNYTVQPQQQNEEFQALQQSQQHQDKEIELSNQEVINMNNTNNIFSNWQNFTKQYQENQLNAGGLFSQAKITESNKFQKEDGIKIQKNLQSEVNYNNVFEDCQKLEIDIKDVNVNDEFDQKDQEVDGLYINEDHQEQNNAFHSILDKNIPNVNEDHGESINIIKAYSDIDNILSQITKPSQFSLDAEKIQTLINNPELTQHLINILKEDLKNKGVNPAFELKNINKNQQTPDFSNYSEILKKQKRKDN